MNIESALKNQPKRLRMQAMLELCGDCMLLLTGAVGYAEIYRLVLTVAWIR